MTQTMKITRKVALNRAPGGFRLTTMAARELAKRKGLPFVDLTAEMGHDHYAFGKNYETFDQVCTRDDPDLIAIIEEYGEQASVGGTVKVMIVTLEMDIEDKNGFESVHAWGNERAS